MASSTPSAETVGRMFDHLGPPGTPFTTPEIAAEFDCSDRTIYNRLEGLVETGAIETKKVGAKGRVWWQPVRSGANAGSSTDSQSSPVAQSSLLHSDGEMAERIRGFKWSETPLGPIEDWPPQLRVAVDISLGSSEAIGIYWGDDFRLLYNDAAIEQIGDKHPDALGQPAREVFPEAWDELGTIHEQVLAGDGPIQKEEDYLPLERSGELEDIWWDSSFNPIPDADGSVGGVFNISFEVTERVRTKRHLRKRKRETEHRYRHLFESIDQGFTIVDVIFDDDEPVDYRIIEANETFETFTGLTDPEGKTVNEMGAELESYWYERYGHVVNTGESARFEERVEAWGKWFDVFAFPVEDGDRPNVGVLFDDITQRKQQETALRESQERLDSFVSATAEVVYRMSPDWSEMYHLDGKGFIQDTEDPREDWLDEYIPTAEEERVKTAIEEAIETNSQFELEHQVRQVDGSLGWTNSRAVPVCSADGEILEWFGTATDITERKRREREKGYLLDLNDALRPLTDPAAIQEEACRVLGEHLDVKRAQYGELDLDRELIDITRDYYRGGQDVDELPSLVGEFDFDDFPAHAAAWLEQRSLIVNDAERDEALSESERAGMTQREVRATLSTPLVKNGEPVVVMAVTSSEPRQWTEKDIALLEETADRTWEAVQRAQVEEALRESEERFRAVANLVPSLLWSNDPEGATLWYNQQWLDYTGQAMEEDADYGWLKTIHPEDREQSLENFQSAVDAGEPLRQEHRIRRHDGEYHWFLVQVRPVRNGGEIVRWFGAATDIHDQRKMRAALERLNDVSRELISADSVSIADQVAEGTADVLEFEYAALWQYDDGTGILEVTDEYSKPETNLDVVRPPAVSHDRIWETFIGDEIDIDDALDSAEDEPWPSRLGSRAFVPLGRHGVLVVGSVNTRPFDRWRLDLLEMVASTIEAAWDRAASERALEEHNEELTRLDQLNTLIRRIDQGLVDADTVGEIDDMVCEQLAASALFACAWIGEYDADDGEITPRAWAGVDSVSVEALTATPNGSPTEASPFVDAVRSGEMQAIADIATDSRASSWRVDALRLGARSCLVIPLTYNESIYGVLVVYGSHPQPDGRKRDVIWELGRTVGHTIHAIETRRPSPTDSVVQLTLRTTTADTPLVRLAREQRCEIEFEGLIPDADTGATVFFTARDIPPEDVVAATECSLAFGDVTELTDREDGHQFKAQVTDDLLVESFLDEGASISSLSIDSGTATAVVTVDTSTDVRQFIERVKRDVPDLELFARRTHRRSHDLAEQLETAFESRLTSRQQEILQLAYRSGYFESPRKQTGQELSALLDLSQSTFNHHLRGAERRLFEVVFDDR